MEFHDETNSTTIPFTSAADGSFLVRPLLAGNYTLTATDGDLASIPTRIRAANAAQSLNVTLLPVGTVSGTTTLFGTAQPFANLSFQSASEPRTIRQTASDTNARYSIRLPAGEWFVSGRFYASNLLYATLGRVVVARGSMTSFDAMFGQGVRLSGTVSDANPAVRNPDATVALANAAGQVWLQTDSAGGYFTFLPVGTYDLEAFNPAGASFASVTLTGTTRLNIAIVATSETVGWTVYRDANRNSGVNPGEAIAGARVSLTDDRGAHIVFTTNGTGEFRIPLFANRTYAGLVTAAGFADRPIGSSSPIQLRTLMPIALTPIPVQVQGSVLVNGSAVLSHPVTVTAVPLGSGAVGSATQTDSNGGYGFGLVPGTYALVVDENVSSTRATRYQNQGTDRIVAAVGEGTLPYDINIVVRNLVSGNVTLNGTARAAALTFDGPDRRAVSATATGFEVYLIPGSYAATGSGMIGANEYAFMSMAAIPSATNLSFPLTKATTVSGRALVNGDRDAIDEGPPGDRRRLRKREAEVRRGRNRRHRHERVLVRADHPASGGRVRPGDQVDLESGRGGAHRTAVRTVEREGRGPGRPVQRHVPADEVPHDDIDVVRQRAFADRRDDPVRALVLVPRGPRRRDVLVHDERVRPRDEAEAVAAVRIRLGRAADGAVPEGNRGDSHRMAEDRRSVHEDAPLDLHGDGRKGDRHQRTELDRERGSDRSVGKAGRRHESGVRPVGEERDPELAGPVRREDDVCVAVVRQADAGPGDRLARIDPAVPVRVAVHGPSDRFRRGDEGDVETGRPRQRDAREGRARLVERLEVVRPDRKEGEVSPGRVGLEPHLPGCVRQGDRRPRIPDRGVRVAHRAAQSDALHEHRVEGRRAPTDHEDAAQRRVQQVRGVEASADEPLSRRESDP